jgi:hypothetical protein
MCAQLGLSISDATLSDQLQGWGTLAAVLVSLVVLGFDIRARRLATVAEERAQARRVMVSAPQHTGGGQEQTPEGLVINVAPTVDVHNRSDEVINDVVIKLWIEPPTALVGPNVDGAQHRIGRMIPEQSFTWSAPFKVLTEQRPLGTEYTPHECFADVEFTDAAGTRWRRERNHDLTFLRRPSRGRRK